MSRTLRCIFRAVGAKQKYNQPHPKVPAKHNAVRTSEMGRALQRKRTEVGWEEKPVITESSKRQHQPGAVLPTKTHMKEVTGPGSPRSLPHQLECRLWNRWQPGGAAGMLSMEPAGPGRAFQGNLTFN